MSFLSKLFNKKTRQPEDDYEVTINDVFVRVQHPKGKTEQISWENIKCIKLINTDQGPWLPDIWLALEGEMVVCMIPHGAKGFDEVYQIISTYDGFNFDNFILSMSSTNNEEFVVWVKK